ncbi:MAG: hypothetical protein Q9Q13_04130 [Acidobacteriota bacterium]|nr:hypothetical protein [Acidobacteriota bacterium]
MRCAVLLAVVAAAVLGPGPVLASGSPWSFEARAMYINPVGGDGTMNGLANSTTVDFHAVLVPELVAGYRVNDSFTVDLGLSIASFDVQFDIDTAGPFDAGEADMTMIQVAGIWDLTQWGDTAVRLGVVLAQAMFDDLNLSQASATESLRRVTLDDALLYGVTLRFDTPIGDNGWYFSSNLRYLMGGPDIAIERYVSSTPTVIGTGSADLDPLTVSLGVGYQY